jgi:hypothetical protein
MGPIHNVFANALALTWDFIPDVPTLNGRTVRPSRGHRCSVELHSVRSDCHHDSFNCHIDTFDGSSFLVMAASFIARNGGGASTGGKEV